MTLIVAIGCEDGAIIASESASTDMESGTKQPSKKIKRLKTENILYGGSGDVGLLQKVDEALEAYVPRNNLKHIRQELKRLIIPVLRESRKFHASYPLPGYNLPPMSIQLFVGITENKPWILEIEKDGRDTFYGEKLGNFYAIGSGKPWAQAFFRPFLNETRDVQLGKIFACRIICNAIELASKGLAEPIQMYVLEPNQEPEEVKDDELKMLKDTCELWKEMERETVGKLLAPPEESISEPEIPKT